jgi:hypothetical protein
LADPKPLPQKTAKIPRHGFDERTSPTDIRSPTITPRNFMVPPSSPSDPSSASWPFSDPPNVAVITTTGILRSGDQILHVAHDDDDGTWHFNDGAEPDEDDAMVVTLQDIFDLDPSIAELANLPEGWAAERSARGKAWKRHELSAEGEDGDADDDEE